MFPFEAGMASRVHMGRSVAVFLNTGSLLTVVEHTYRGAEDCGGSWGLQWRCVDGLSLTGAYNVKGVFWLSV